VRLRQRTEKPLAYAKDRGKGQQQQKRAGRRTATSGGACGADAADASQRHVDEVQDSVCTQLRIAAELQK